MSINNHKPVYVNLRKFLMSEMTLQRKSLSIDKLSQQFNASTIPVRESLIRLAAEDYIDYEIGKGFYTKELSLKYIQDNYRLLYRVIRWSIDCNNLNKIPCKKFLDWIKKERITINIESDDSIIFYESAMTYAVLCFSEIEHHYFLKNVIRKTAKFRTLTYNSRIDIEESLESIILIAELLTIGKKEEALVILSHLEEMRVNNIPIEYEMMTNSHNDFDFLVDE